MLLVFYQDCQFLLGLFLPVCIVMEFDWGKCIFFCQKDTNEHLRCPLYTLRLADPTNVYKSFLDNVQQFRAFTALPVELYVTADETAENFASHCASWHKSCRSKFNKTKLKRARKAEIEAILLTLKKEDCQNVRHLTPRNVFCA